MQLIITLRKHLINSLIHMNGYIEFWLNLNPSSIDLYHDKNIYLISIMCGIIINGNNKILSPLHKNYYIEIRKKSFIRFEWTIYLSSWVSFSLLIAIFEKVEVHILILSKFVFFFKLLMISKLFVILQIALYRVAMFY